MDRDQDHLSLSSMSPEAVVEACEFNYIDYWRSVAAGRPGTWSDSGGIERCITGLPQEIFNVVLRCDLPPGSVAARVDRAIDEFRARRIPMIWHVGRTTVPSDLGSHLEKRGFPHDYDLVAMAVNTSMPHELGEPPRGTAVRRCSGRTDIEAWIDCLTRSWDSPSEVGRWMRANPFFGLSGGRSAEDSVSRTMYLGLLDEVPSGAVMLLRSRGVAGLQCVGTVAGARRRGLGEAMVRAALHDASANQHMFVVVLSTTEGVPLYKKAGFREFGKLPEHSLYFDKTAP